MDLRNYPRHISLLSWGGGMGVRVGNTYKVPIWMKIRLSFKWTALQAQKSHQSPHTSATLWQCNHFVHWILHLFFNISLSPVCSSLFLPWLAPLHAFHFHSHSKWHFFQKLYITQAVPYYFNPEVRTPVTTLSSLSLIPSFPSLTLSLYPPNLHSYLTIPLILTSEASPLLLPHLSLALNQMEHIKSGTRSRQWLLWLPAVFDLAVLHRPIKCHLYHLIS